MRPVEPTPRNADNLPKASSQSSRAAHNLLDSRRDEQCLMAGTRLRLSQSLPLLYGDRSGKDPHESHFDGDMGFAALGRRGRPKMVLDNGLRPCKMVVDKLAQLKIGNCRFQIL